MQFHDESYNEFSFWKQLGFSEVYNYNIFLGKPPYTID